MKIRLNLLLHVTLTFIISMKRHFHAKIKSICKILKEREREIDIYIYIYRERERERESSALQPLIKLYLNYINSELPEVTEKPADNICYVEVLNKGIELKNFPSVVT